MTSVTGIIGTTAPVITPYLKGFYPINHGTAVTDKVLIDPTGTGANIRTHNSVNLGANFWSTQTGRGYFDTTATRFGNPTLTDFEIGETNTSYILSCRIRTALAPIAIAAIMGKRQQTNFYGNLMSVRTDGAIHHRYRGAHGNFDGNSTTSIADDAEHHVVLWVDKTANREIYLDGVADWATGTQDMTGSLAGDTSATVANFTIGFEGTLEGITDKLLYDGVTPVYLWDVHIYMKTGTSSPAALPTDVSGVISYLKNNLYSPLPADFWS